MENFYQEVEPVIDISMRKLCIFSYYNHQKGCPNFNKKKGCPPSSPTIDKIIDLSRPIYIIYNKFNFKQHVDRMGEKYPNWTIRQLECCLYWQGTARKRLREKIGIFKSIYPELFIVNTPEGAGVNLTVTMEKIGIKLEWPPKKYTYQIVLAGKRKK